MLLAVAGSVFAQGLPSKSTNAVVLLGESEPVLAVAVERLKAKLGGSWDVLSRPPPPDWRYDQVVYLGHEAEIAKLTSQVPASGLAREEYAIASDGKTVYVAGADPNGIVFGTYAYVEHARFKGGKEPQTLRRRPLVPRRYAWATQHSFGGTVYRPQLFWQRTLPELPRLGINGVFLIGFNYLGPRGMNMLLPLERAANGEWKADSSRLAEYRLMLQALKARGLEVCLAVAPVAPHDYPTWQIKLHYAGLQHFENLERRIEESFRDYLEALHRHLPEIDCFMLASNEGVGLGSATGQEGVNLFLIDYRLFRWSLRTPERSETALEAYLRALDTFCKQRGKAGGFWTHNSGATWQDFRAMHRALAKFPDLIALENPWFPDVGWKSLDFLGFLPPEVRDTVHQKSRLGVIFTVSDAQYEGAGRLPTSLPAPFIRATDQLVARGAEMTVVRLDDWDFTEYGTLFNVNAILPSIVGDRSWSAPFERDELWLRLCADRFGAAAAPQVLRVLHLAEPIQQRGLSIAGLSTLAHSTIRPDQWLPAPWRTNPDLGPKVVRHSASLFTAFARPGTKLVQHEPGEYPGIYDFIAFQLGATAIPIARFRADQEAAKAACTSAIGILEDARADLAPADYEYLLNLHRRAAVLLEATRLLGEAAYATNLVIENYDAVPAPSEVRNQALLALEQFAESLGADSTLWHSPEDGPPHAGFGGLVVNPPIRDALLLIADRYRAAATNGPTGAVIP